MAKKKIISKEEREMIREKRVIMKTDTGCCVLIPTGELSLEDTIKKDVPEGIEYEIVDKSEIPSDRTFRNAWEKKGKKIETNIPKAKLLAHEMRRDRRSKELKTWDDLISLNIPDSDLVGAEKERAKIRKKYDILQTKIDAASTESELKLELGL